MNGANIGFIGAGNMANSLIRGLLAKGTSPALITAADVDASKLATLQQECDIAAATVEQIASTADVIVLAVKPQVMATVCRSLDTGKRSPLFVSIAAGITIDHLQSWLGSVAAIVRCMPNTPALVGKGASGLFANPTVSAEQRQLAERLMATVGLACWVESESDIDTVTAVSGSGPAYFFLFMEAMQDAAREMGLSDELARSLTYQTAAGAAELAMQSEDDTAELRRKVTSPGGTTEQAIATLESGGIRELVANALQAARSRSIELADEFGDD